MEPSRTRGLLGALGPGMLFAAAAIGVSHLVQSTRAGATHGLALVGLIVLANVVKYPAFRFGPHYAAATGTSLLEGYRRQGRWALSVYGLLTLGTMFSVMAAVTVVTAGLAIATLGLPLGPVSTSGVLILACAALLAVGRYHLLDRVTKWLVGVLTISTLVSTALALTRIDWASVPTDPFAIQWDAKTVFFVVALVGWMPSAIDISVWQSLWTLAKGADDRRPPTLSESTLDFHIGYVGTALLALCFVIMGAGVMYGSGAPIADSAGGFAAQVIELYSTTLGSWAAPIIGLCAFAVMFSTTLTVLDGFPRALTTLFARFSHAEDPTAFEAEQSSSRRVYWAALLLLSIGALAILAFLLRSLRSMIDVATTLSFLTAPVLATLNHRAVQGSELPAGLRPKQWLMVMSLICILAQAALALVYLFVRYS